MNNNQIKSARIIIDEEFAGKRVDQISSILDYEISRNILQKTIKSGNVKLFDQILIDVSYKLKFGDIIDIKSNISSTTQNQVNKMFEILYEDNDILVINKSKGVVTCPGIGYESSGTLMHELINRYGIHNFSNINENNYGIVHRLDKNTSGIILIAKNNNAHISLSAQIQTNKCKRIYQTLIWGVPDSNNGIIDTLITKKISKMLVSQNEGKRSITHYKILEKFKHLSLVECSLETGRTHQIRVHMNHIGHSVFGDNIYGNNKRKINKYYKKNSKLNRKLVQFIGHGLHASFIKFIHPTSSEVLSFYSEMQSDTLDLIKCLKEENRV